MASFDSSKEMRSGSNCPPQYLQLPLRRVERSVQGFLKVIQIDLCRLHRHRLNMEKYERLQDWTGLHTEQVNASRTVQQVTANVREIERVRLQVVDTDLEQFDDKVKDMKQAALHSVAEFIDVAQGIKQEGSSQDSSPDNELRPLVVDSPWSKNGGPTSLPASQMTLKQLPQNSIVSESWDNLQENLEDLNAMIHKFAHTVHSQQEGLDRIEDNIESAHDNVQKGTRHLGQATKYKMALLPLAGAVIGTVVAGPVGLLAGAKIGGVIAAVGGSAAGFLGGKFLKRRQERMADMEMSQLVPRSNSLPDLVDPATTSSWNDLARRRNQSERQIETPD